MKRGIRIAIVSSVIGLSVGLQLKSCSIDKEVMRIEEAEAEFVISEPIPVVRIDTVYSHSTQKPVQYIAVENPVNKELLEAYKKARDSIQKMLLFKEAVTQRKYVEVVSDSLQEITVESEVVGTLLSQKISYVTKAYDLEVVQERKRKFPSLYVGIYNDDIRGGDLFRSTGLKLSVKSGQILFDLGINSNKNVFLGVGIKLF